MKWIRKSPFSCQEAAAEHMIVLLSQEADRHDTPLSETEKKMLASESASGELFLEASRLRLHKLIGQILEREKTTDIKNDPKSFLASFEWASDNADPQIVSLTEEMITGGGFGHLPPLHGRKWIKDRAQLIGCGLLLVLTMMLIVVICSLIFQRK